MLEWNGQHSFPTTEWTSIHAARDPSRDVADPAIARLCEHYWYPIYCFIRLRGHPAHDAADLTQAYFARLLAGRLLEVADRSKGRFRSLLKHDCRYFLMDSASLREAIKRGGGVRHEPLASVAEDRFSASERGSHDPETAFERAWACEVLNRALARLETEERDAGRGAAYDVLRPLLVEPSPDITYEHAGQKLGLSVTAVDGAVRRLKERFRRALRGTIALTQENPTDESIEQELRDLSSALQQ